MSDVNEELVRRYFELQGYFVRTNLKYEYRTPKGMGWSDVDLCVLHPITGDAAAVEVKGWHMESITPSYFRDWPSMLYPTREEARRAVVELLGRDDFCSVLVVSRIGPRGGAEVLAKAAEAGVEILEFRKVLDFLIEHVPRNRDAGSESEHVIRLLKIYGQVNEDRTAAN
ncbi:MAG: hypothetical protein ACRDQ2_01720 [Gaiellales bacterium]